MEISSQEIDKKSPFISFAKVRIILTIPNKISKESQLSLLLKGNLQSSPTLFSNKVVGAIVVKM